MFDLKLTEDDYREMVHLDDGKLTTTSQKLAERFGKRHDSVLRAIDNLKCSAGFRLHNFVETVTWRENPSGGDPIRSRGFDMTKDGYMYLAMGFTGAKAAAWKEGFIAAFNWMAEQLSHRAVTFEQRRNEVMLEIKQEEAVASLAGRTLCRWKYRKPVLHSKMLALEHEGQTQLKLH